MSYNLITFSNYFFIESILKMAALFGQPLAYLLRFVRAAIGVSVTMLLIIQENGEMLSISRKNFQKFSVFRI